MVIRSVTVHERTMKGKYEGMMLTAADRRVHSEPNHLRRCSAGHALTQRSCRVSNAHFAAISQRCLRPISKPPLDHRASRPPPLTPPTHRQCPRQHSHHRQTKTQLPRRLAAQLLPDHSRHSRPVQHADAPRADSYGSRTICEQLPARGTRQRVDDGVEGE